MAPNNFGIDVEKVLPKDTVTFQFTLEDLYGKKGAAEWRKDAAAKKSGDAYQATPEAEPSESAMDLDDQVISKPPLSQEPQTPPQLSSPMHVDQPVDSNLSLADIVQTGDGDARLAQAFLEASIEADRVGRARVNELKDQAVEAIANPETRDYSNFSQQAGTVFERAKEIDSISTQLDNNLEACKTVSARVARLPNTFSE